MNTTVKINGENVTSQYKGVMADVKEGGMQYIEYTVTNSGNYDMIISSVVTSCGCTDAEYDRTPIKPGDSTIVKFGFNSSGKKGFNSKSGTMYGNFDTIKLIFDVNVI